MAADGTGTWKEGSMAGWKREIGAMTLFVPNLGEAPKFYADACGLDAQPLDDGVAMLPFEGILLRRRDRCPVNDRHGSPSSAARPRG